LADTAGDDRFGGDYATLSRQAFRTPDQSDRQPKPPPAPGAFQEGIYLETRKSAIGTGSTAKTTEYRNFWATAIIKADSAVMVLLNDEFKPTVIRETFSLEALAGPNWFYIAEGEKKYNSIRPLLEREAAPEPPKPAAAEAPAKAANWWDSGSSSSGGPPANPFEINKSKKARPTPKKGGWWDK
jgi:hypothetical protein